MCESPYDLLYEKVFPGIGIPRAFATLGLLRKVTNRAPLDLLLTYCSLTHGNRNGWVMETRINDEIRKMFSDTDISKYALYDDSGAVKPTAIPDGIIRMAKDYLVRMFWTQLEGVKEYVNGYYRADGSFDDDGVCAFKIFPKRLLDTIRTVRISPNFKLWDARNAIQDIHTACVGNYGEMPEWMADPRRRMDNFVRRDKMGTLEDIHVRNLQSLRVVIDNYRWNNLTKLSIPNEVEKNLLIDFYEIMVMMFSKMQYASAYCHKQSYDYFCKHNDDSEPPAMKITNSFNETSETKTGYHLTESVNPHLRYLTPEAAICIDLSKCDLNSSVCEYDWKKVNRDLVPEVHPYLFTEQVVVRHKMRKARKILEKFGVGRSSCCCDPCDAEAPCVPEPCSAC